MHLTKDCFYVSLVTAPKSRITKAEATVVQMSNIAVSRKRDVIFFGAPFLVLFWRSKKEQEKKLMISLILQPPQTTVKRYQI
jgi:hypothetical protein